VSVARGQLSLLHEDFLAAIRLWPKKLKVIS
jgi:hypothetical protein